MSGKSSSLPPSVESAYRRKCIELKRRMVEVETSNDEYRLRRTRLHRGVLKLRLERGFLLEQLAQRTSQNVEDSEGSPSPPPAQEKPLRTKRGRRDDEDGERESPASPLFVVPGNQHTGGGGRRARRGTGGRTARSATKSTAEKSGAGGGGGGGGGVVGGEGPKVPKRDGPRTAYEIFTQSTISEMYSKHPLLDEDDEELRRVLASAWRDMGVEGRTKWQAFEEQEKNAWKEKEAVASTAAEAAAAAVTSSKGTGGSKKDEDTVDREEDEDADDDEPIPDDELEDVIMGDDVSEP